MVHDIHAAFPYPTFKIRTNDRANEVPTVEYNMYNVHCRYLVASWQDKLVTLLHRMDIWIELKSSFSESLAREWSDMTWVYDKLYPKRQTYCEPRKRPFSATLPGQKKKFKAATFCVKRENIFSGIDSDSSTVKVAFTFLFYVRVVNTWRKREEYLMIEVLTF